MILELTEWKWDIPTILRQPDPELWAVMHMKAIGERMRTQARKKSKDGSETI